MVRLTSAGRRAIAPRATTSRTGLCAVTNGVVTGPFRHAQQLTAWRIAFHVPDLPVEVRLSIRRDARKPGRLRPYVQAPNGAWRLCLPSEHYYTTYAAARAALVQSIARGLQMSAENHRWWRRHMAAARKLPRTARTRRTRR